MRPFINSEGWLVIGLCPHVDSTGAFGMNLNTLYSTFWSLKEVFSAMNKAIRLYVFYHPHLAIGVWQWEFWRSPLYWEGRTWGVTRTWSGKKPIPRIKRKKSLRIWNLSNSSPALAASWQSVFGFLYWGARPEEPVHNRSSSPFTTLADIAECKVVSTGAGQPNYWPKTWFGADAYNAISSGCRTALKKVFGLYCRFAGRESPWWSKMYQGVRVQWVVNTKGKEKREMK